LGYVYHAGSLKARLLRPAVTSGLRLACGIESQRLIVQNSDDFDFCVRSKICPPDRIVLIRGSGVDVDRYRPLPEPGGVPLVTLPGRMLWDKGVGEFVAAARLLRASGLRARFALVGSLDPNSPAAVPLETLKRWQASGVVEWWGWCDDIRAVIEQSQVVCLPSYGEGAPRALMEASACGRAIVTTDVSGCRDVVLHGENGLLVPPRDVQGLARALRLLITQPGVRARLASNGPTRMADHFSLRGVIANTLDVYRELMGVEREASLTSVA
jgi:glycosyltransferase involved in cell wall biosynthesis